jgi:integrase/recombinase XerD
VRGSHDGRLPPTTGTCGRSSRTPWRTTSFGVDPMARMRRPKPPRGAPRPLTAEQVQLVLGAAKPTVRTWLVLGLYAGLRSHEIAKLAGQDVNARQMFVLGKGGARDLIPTHPLIWAEAQKRPASGWWFPSRVPGGHVTNMTVSTMTTQLFKANGIEGSIHRCRHTFATNLLRSGVNVRIVQELMRHASLTSTMLYTEVSEDECLEGIMRLGA